MGAESMGVLVGWTHSEFNGKVNLRLQSVRSSRCTSQDDVDSHYFMMTHSQAAVLATYLLDMTGQEAPRPRRRSLLQRLTRA